MSSNEFSGLEIPKNNSLPVSPRRERRLFSCKNESDNGVALEKEMGEVRRSLGTCNPNNPEFENLCRRLRELAKKLAPNEHPDDY